MLNIRLKTGFSAFKLSFSHVLWGFEVKMIFKRRKTGLDLNISRNSYENNILHAHKNWLKMLIFHVISKKTLLHFIL